MKNYYQFSAEEVKQDINGKQEPLTAAEVKHIRRSSDQTTGRREEKEPHFRSFWSNTKISL